MLLDAMLQRFVKVGAITIVEAGGREKSWHGAEGGPVTKIRFTDARVARDLMKNPELAVCEAYMDGRIEILEGSLYEFMDFLIVNAELQWQAQRGSVINRLRLGLRKIQQYNPVGRAKQNIAHHYDLTDEFYRLFLDEDQQYSCSYFPSPDIGLEESQLLKKRHIAAKLLLQPGQKVLDIGSGWGGLGLTIAELGGGDVTGVTLSERQHEVSNERARGKGVAGRVRFLLQDYRHLRERFDRIVSVGMFEHVGVNHYDEFFGKVRDLLADDGVMLLHSIGRMEGPSWTSAFIRKYIFPGGYIPALSEVLPAIERAGLWVTDVEILRLHYAETLRHWRMRFLARRGEAKALYDERFCRMWEIYLIGSELFFRRQRGMVFQIQLAKDRHAVPLTRDYMVDTERAWRCADQPAGLRTVGGRDAA
ncbi:SAM-dependent methyltransferase [Geminicoccus flavidas]|uniref:SAM-dependent methyltransferase n=1 Tax=Geminicoccus flavidas TaxID=2506407 RepID=UPI00135AA2D0|nr:cyclopropane-fatty-acyl-phospholipid synthase family protein [Geminicoccus flavidas]